MERHIYVTRGLSWSICPRTYFYVFSFLRQVLSVWPDVDQASFCLQSTEINLNVCHHHVGWGGVFIYIFKLSSPLTLFVVLLYFSCALRQCLTM